MQHRLVGPLVTCVFLSVGCVGGDERRAGGGATDTATTSLPDTAGEVAGDAEPTTGTTGTGVSDAVTGGDEGPADTTTRPDLVEPDGTSVEPDGVIEPDDTVDEETVTSGCLQDDDCLGRVELGPCELPRCHDGQCLSKAADETVECDDENPCTDHDRCSANGCKGTIVAAGTRCDDGAGAPADLCDQGWFGPEDRCDANGQCSPGVFTPPAEVVLVGAWYVVVSSGLRGELETIRAQIDVDAAGAVDLRQATSSEGAIEPSGVSGIACMHPEGPLEILLGGATLTGWANPTFDTMVLGDGATNGLGVALRPTGEPIDVDGRYHLLWTTSTGGEEPRIMTWYGYLDFEEGCVSAVGTVATSQGLGTARTLSPSPAAPCIAATELGDTLDLLMVDGSEPEQSTPLTWVGAIGPEADVLLFTQANDDGGIAYGTIALVRARGENPSGGLRGAHAYIEQRRGAKAGNLGVSAAMRWGFLQLTPPSSVSGFELSPDEVIVPVTQGWFTLGPNGRYAHRLEIGLVAEHVAGWLAPRDDFVLGFVPPAVAGATTPSPLADSVAEGSLFVMVRAGMPVTANDDDK